MIVRLEPKYINESGVAWINWKGMVTLSACESIIVTN